VSTGVRRSLTPEVHEKKSQGFLTKEAPPSTESYALYATGSGGPNAIDPPGDTPLNQWTHLAFTLKDGTGRLYRNGQLVSSTPGLGSAVSTGGALRIGGNTIWSDEGFIGLIDDVRVWDVALPASDIAGHVPGASSAPLSARQAPAVSTVAGPVAIRLSAFAASRAN